MIQAMTSKILGQLVSRHIIEEADRDIYEYGISCRIAMILLVVLLGGLSAVSGVIPEAAGFALCFAAVKREIGGWHLNSHGTCLLGSTLLVMAGAHLCRRCPEDWLVPLSAALCVAALALIYRLAPVPHPNNPQTAGELEAHRQLARSAAWKIVAILLSAYFLLKPEYLATVSSGAAGLCSAAITLLIPNRKEEAS